MLFSQKYGFMPIKKIIQINSMDDELRNSLWNALTLFYWDKVNWLYKKILYGETRINPQIYLFKMMWINYFKKPVDTLSYEWDITYKEIRKYFLECEWYRTYDFIQFVADTDPDKENSSGFRSYCNKIFEQELSGYRFADTEITPITSQEEITSIEEAMQISGKFYAATIHLKTSLRLMSDRNKPDFRNSIKESISAVEAICEVIVDDQKATLGKALRIIETKAEIELHPSLRSAFDKLYGYTSDADGIRHALLDEPNLKFEDAKFMLVSCTAFINYLVDKSK